MFTIADVAAPMVEKTPELMAAALSRSLSWIASMARVIWPSETAKGPLVSQSRMVCRPSDALRTSAGVWPATCGARMTMTIVTASRNNSSTARAASGDGTPCRRSQAAPGCSTVATMRASTIGKMTTQSCPITHPRTKTPAAMSTMRSPHR